MSNTEKKIHHHLAGLFPRLAAEFKQKYNFELFASQDSLSFRSRISVNFKYFSLKMAQLTVACSKSTLETLDRKCCEICSKLTM